MDSGLILEWWNDTALLYGKVEQGGHFSNPVDNKLKVRFDVCYKGTDIDKGDLQHKILDRFDFCIMAAEFKERPDVRSIFYISEIVAGNKSK